MVLGSQKLMEVLNNGGRVFVFHSSPDKPKVMDRFEHIAGYANPGTIAKLHSAGAIKKTPFGVASFEYTAAK
jgi:hypothetical protein